ncbi:MAG: ArgR family transcriptional regulator [Sphaerochaetaceae bacterium]|nr:ArgR family transcriptional regulator [Sphaerochaetaceae bacterium]
MKQRLNRLTAVREMIKKNRIENQDTLLQMLKEEGYDVTQATLSRDLKMLKVGKISDGWSGYYYSLPVTEAHKDAENSFELDIRRGIVSLEFNGNMGVIKTRQGHANSVAFALDAIGMPEILGTIAGDDTIFVLLREGMTKEDLLEDFRKKVPEIEQ